MKVRASAALLVVLVIGLPDAGVARSRIVGVPVSGAELGLGWDSLGGRIVPNRCVEFAPVEETGQHITLDMQQVSDTSELMESLGVSASVSVKSIFGSGSAEAEFAKSVRVSSSSTSLVMDASVENGVVFAGPALEPEPARSAFPTVSSEERQGPTRSWWRRIFPEPRSKRFEDAVTLKKWAWKKLDCRRDADRPCEESEVRDFRRHCGDAYVSGIYSGASLLALFTFETKSIEESEKVAAAIEANYSVGSLSGKVQQEQKDETSSTDIKVHYTQVGGSSGIIPIDPDGFRLKLEELPIEAARAPQLYALRVTPYSDLPDWPGGAWSPSEEHNEVLADRYWLLRSLYSDIEEVLGAKEGAYSSASGLDAEGLRVQQDQVQEILRDLREVVENGGLGPIELRSPVFAGLSADPDTWLGEFVQRLKGYSEGDPRILYLRLPLPAAIVDAGTNTNIAELAVEWYVGRQAKRVCVDDPTDPECLSNRVLADYQRYVPVNRALTSGMLHNLLYETCLHLPGPEENLALETAECLDPSGEDARHQRFFYNAEGTCTLRIAAQLVDPDGETDPPGEDLSESKLWLGRGLHLGSKLKHRPCLSNQYQAWRLEGRLLKNGRNECVRATAAQREPVEVVLCDASDMSQWWRLTL